MSLNVFKLLKFVILILEWNFYVILEEKNMYF